MARTLASRRCEACRSDTPPVQGDALVRLLGELGGGWRVVDGPRLEKEYRFRDWREALAFVNRVGEVAEREAHHPDVFLAWGRVRLELWTHAIGGLSENDFILAAKADAALAR